MPVRSLFAASEPTACLRRGERVIASYEHPTAMTEYLIERVDGRRRALLAPVESWARLTPPTAGRRERRARKLRVRKLNWRHVKRRGR